MVSHIKTKITGIFFLSTVLIVACNWLIVPTYSEAKDDSEVTIRLHSTIIAEDDRAETQINTPVIIKVLSNDKFYGSEAVIDTLKITKQPQNGAIRIDRSSVEYIPNQGYTGQDIFVYEICNQHDQCDEAQVVVVVKGEEKKPEEEQDEEQENDNYIPPQIPEEEARIVISLPRTGGTALGAGVGIGIFATLLVVLIISQFHKKDKQNNRKKD